MSNFLNFFPNPQNKLFFTHQLILIVVMLLISGMIRFWWVFDMPLTADEAHYGLYAKYLDWSYYDHPPMVGWLQFIIMALLGDDDWVLRIMPNILHIGTGISLFLLTRRLYHHKEHADVIGVTAVLLYEFSLMFQLMGIAMLPDDPLLIFTLLSIFSFDWAYRTNKWVAWISYGVCLGLMGLSKYTAILIALSYFLWMVTTQPLLLLNIRLWLSAMIGIVLILPVIYWNVEHDWISFTYQLEHSSVEGNQWSWLAMARSQLINFLAYGGFLFVSLYMLIVVSIRDGLRCGYQYYQCIRGSAQSIKINKDYSEYLPSLLRWIIVVYFVVFTYSSAQDGHYLPHWVALMFMLSAPFLADKFIGHGGRIKIFHYTKVQQAGMLGVGTFVILMPFILMSVLFLGYAGKRVSYEVWRGMIGWKESAEVVKKIVERDNELSENSIIYVANWSEASRVAWYTRPIGVVPIDSVVGQYDLWFNEEAVNKFEGKSVLSNGLPNKKGVLLAPLKHDELEEAMSYFKQCLFLQKLTFYKYDVPFLFGIWKCIP